MKVSATMQANVERILTCPSLTGRADPSSWRVGEHTQADFDAAHIFLTSFSAKRAGEYVCLRSLWDDITEAPLVQHILATYPRTSVILRGGRQTLAFEPADEISLKIELDPNGSRP